MTRIHPWKFPKQNGWSPGHPGLMWEVALFWAGGWAGDSWGFQPKGSQHPRQSPFQLQIKMSLQQMTCLLLSEMIPKLLPLCSQRLQVMLVKTLAGNFHSWTAFAWLMEQQRLGLRSINVRLSCAADLYLRLWPGDSAANSQWHCPSDLGLLGQLQVLPPHFSLKCIDLTGLPVIQHSDILWAFLLDGCSPCQFNGKLLELQQILSLNKESSFLWLGSDMVNAERWSNISSAFL